MNTFKLYEQLKAAFPKESAEALAHVLSEVVEEIQNTVTKQDFAELKATVHELAEAQKRTEAAVERLTEAQERTDAALKRLTEAQRRTEERMEEGFRLFGLRLEALFARSGSRAEAAFREGLREIVREAGYAVEVYRGQDPEGYINHRPGRSYELDLLVRNGVVIAAEIKSSVDNHDVVRFARAVSLFEQQTGRRVDKRVLIAASSREEARQEAKELGVVLGIDPSALED